MINLAGDEIDDLEDEANLRLVSFMPGGVVEATHDNFLAAKSFGPDDEREYPRQIGIGLVVEKIVRIDAQSCTFTAMLKLSCEWKLTEKERRLWEESKWAPFKGRPPWEPVIDFPNAQNILSRVELPVPYACPPRVFDVFKFDGECYAISYVRVRAVFNEIYELHNFPFDCQDAKIVVESMDASKAVLCPRFKREDFALIDFESFCLPEWELHAPIASFSKDMCKAKTISRSGMHKSTFIFQVKLKRRHHYYVNRILVLAALLTSSSLLTWTIDRLLPHRLLLCFTILLTLVAFQMAMANKLPQVRYFTLLDYYLVSCQRFMILIAVEHGILSKWVDDSKVDDICGLCTACAWVLLNIVWVGFAFRLSGIEEQKLLLDDDQLHDWLARQKQTVTHKGMDGKFRLSRAATARATTSGTTTFRSIATLLPTNSPNSAGSHSD